VLVVQLLNSLFRCGEVVVLLHVGEEITKKSWC
jgi:hypothetical protein